MSSKFPCMLAHKFSAKRIKTWPVAVEPKLDGVRCLFVVRRVYDTITVETLSRAGKPFTSLVAIENSIKLLFVNSGIKYDIVLDGEVRCGDTFKSTVSAVKRKSVQAEGAVFTVFDMIPTFIYFGEMDSMPWSQRRAIMITMLGDNLAELTDNVRLSKVKYADDETSVMRIYAKYRGQGHEGAIIKTLYSLWSPRRSYAYMKLKAHSTDDLVVVGVVEGEGKYVGMLGKFIGRRENGVEVGVGTGITDAQRAAWWNNPGVIGKTIEVGYHEVTPDGSLRHPVFMHFRIDK